MPRLKCTTEKWDIILARTPLLYWNLMAHTYCHSDTLFSCAHKFPRKRFEVGFFQIWCPFTRLFWFCILFFDNMNRNVSALLYYRESGYKEKMNSHGLLKKKEKCTILWVLAPGRHKGRKFASVFIVCFCEWRFWCMRDLAVNSALWTHGINKVLHRNNIFNTFGSKSCQISSSLFNHDKGFRLDRNIY